MPDMLRRPARVFATVPRSRPSLRVIDLCWYRRDEFQNNAALVAPDEELSAELETPNGTVPLILKAHTDARHAVHSADGEGGGGAPQRNLSKKELQGESCRRRADRGV